tara:strand:+ start:221 stop:1987 length:1767 start_codon:yes stop_codon:yes gene_type:complete
MDISENNECYFQLPIYYISDKTTIEQHICDDLNLCRTDSNISSPHKDDDSENDMSYSSVYEHAFLPKSQFSKKTIPLWSKYFTANKKFLVDTQTLIKQKLPEAKTEYKEVEDIWHEIKTETGFHEKYQYINLPLFTWVNNNTTILQLLSMYNIASPIISLALPILFLIIPFFLIRLKGIELTFDKYKEVLYHIISKHHLGKIFSISSVSWDKRIYILMTFGIYLLQTYQHIMSCIQFYKHSKIIHNQLHVIKEYLKHTIGNMEYMEDCCVNLQTYQPFINVMKMHKLALTKYFHYVSIIPPHSISFSKLIDLGRPMKAFYQLYNDSLLQESLLYSFGLNGYISNINGLQSNISKKTISLCSFTKSKTSFKKAYYPPETTGTVHNTYNLDKHILLTGPNASGKTTLLKTTISNLILSQQCGVGFYKKAKIAPYNKIYCYINIPDTSGRDSLFQAEARRCKEILDSIKSSSASERHFCVFDELYSGTNPYEATGGAISFLKYLNKNSTVKFFITTHYLELCKRLDEVNTIKNYHMETIVSQKDNVDTFKYMYKLRKNISTIQGGVKVLCDLEYPEEIISGTKSIIQNLSI